MVALDYSSSVGACYTIVGHHNNIHLVQGDIYPLPFSEERFAFVFSLGVLQHTADVAKTFATLPLMVAEGGQICVDFYQELWKSALLPKYWLRLLIKRTYKRRLFSALEYLVPQLLPISRQLGKIPIVGVQLRRVIPVANYIGDLPVSEKQHLEWWLLDTFNWFSPAFDNPQRPETIRRWLQNAGAENIEIVKAGHLVGRATMPNRKGKKD